MIIISSFSALLLSISVLAFCVLQPTGGEMETRPTKTALTSNNSSQPGVTDDTVANIDQGGQSVQSAGPTTAIGEDSVSQGDGCAFKDTLEDAVENERPGLDKAIERYKRGLISIASLMKIKADAFDRLQEKFHLSSKGSLACVHDSLRINHSLYQVEYFNIIQRNSIDKLIFKSLYDICSKRTNQAGHVECLTFFRDTYSDNLISILVFNDLRTKTFDRLMEILKHRGEEEAWSVVKNLYSGSLISFNQRKSARRQILEINQ